MKRFRTCTVYAFLICILAYFGRCQSSVSTTNKAAETAIESKTQYDLRPIELTSKNFGSYTGDGNIWLLEFYTPWCGHCQDFAKSYGHIASAFHSSPSEKIRVAKIDCSQERALMNRFGISGFPSFYLLDGYSVYEFHKLRTEANLMDFARGAYKQQEPIPFWISPMGPIGQLQQVCITLGVLVLDTFETIQSKYGISPILTGLALSALGIVGGMISIILLAIITTPRAKVD